MWYLVILVCVGLECEPLSIAGAFTTKAACVAKMDTEYETLQSGRAIMCSQFRPDIRLVST